MQQSRSVSSARTLACCGAAAAAASSAQASFSTVRQPAEDAAGGSAVAGRPPSLSRCDPDGETNKEAVKIKEKEKKRREINKQKKELSPAAWF